MSEQEKREDGSYWIRMTPSSIWEIARFKYGEWHVTDYEGAWDGSTMDIGPRVQRDSEVVRQRDELLSELRIVVAYLPKELQDITWRRINKIEAEKSGVKP